MNNCEKLQEVSNESVDWMLPKFQSIKDTSVDLTIIKILQGCVGKAEIIKTSDAVGTSILRGSADDIVLNPTLDVLSVITLGGWNLQGDNHILIDLNVFKRF